MRLSKQIAHESARRQASRLVSLLMPVAAAMAAADPGSPDPGIIAMVDQVEAGLRDLRRDLLSDTELLEIGYFGAMRNYDASYYRLYRRFRTA